MIWGLIANSTSSSLPGAWEALAPQPIENRILSTLTLGAWVLILALILPWLRRAQTKVHPEGRLFDWLNIVGGVLRAAVILTVMLLLLITLPERFSHLTAWLFLAAVIGAGFTLRDVAGSLLAWMILLTEGRIQQGVSVMIQGHSGTVQRLGPRVLWIVDAAGHTLAIPNQMVLKHTTQIDETPHPLVTVQVRLPDEVPEHAAAALLQEAVLTSPWVAPGAEARCHPSPNTPRVWQINTRVLGASMRDVLEAHLAARITATRDS